MRSRLTEGPNVEFLGTSSIRSCAKAFTLGLGVGAYRRALWHGESTLFGAWLLVDVALAVRASHDSV
jgi:hypothetical protein